MTCAFFTPYRAEDSVFRVLLEKPARCMMCPKKVLIKLCISCTPVGFSYWSKSVSAGLVKQLAEREL